MSDINISRESLDAAWEDFQTAAIGYHDHELGVDLFGTDGMCDEAYGIYQIALALRAAFDAAEADRRQAVMGERERCVLLIVKACEYLTHEGLPGYHDLYWDEDVQRLLIVVREGVQP